jgi:hypothetical protein
MAYPTGAEIRAMLPAAGAGITDLEGQAFVDEWVERVRLAAPPLLATDPTPENGVTRRIVREGAEGDALKLQRQRDALPTDDAVEQIARAEESLATYDRENVGVDETTTSAALTGLPW